MVIKFFNGWYFFWIILSIASVVGLYFLLRKKSQKTQKIVLFCLLALGLVLHFTKFFYPPYSNDTSRLYRDIWFNNICAANIALFPFIFLLKNKVAKDYMFYLGILGGLGAVLIPIEPLDKVNQAAEWIDIIRFYIHHTMLYAVPLLMVKFKLHTLSYKRVLWCPIFFIGVLTFILTNQILQSELGFTALRNNNFMDINYKNPSMIWGPSGGIGNFLASLCPKIFTYVPVGAYAGQVKYWPVLWLLVPSLILITPVCFGLCMIFDHKNFTNDLKNLKQKFKNKKINKEKLNS